MIRNLFNIHSTTYTSRLLRLLRPSDNGLLLLLAVTVGLATAIALWLFHEAIHLFQDLFLDHLAQDWLGFLNGLGLVISLSLAGYLIGWITQRFVGQEKYHGVTGIIEAVALAGGRLRYRVMPQKALASSLSLGAGGSVGPEDPSVQIGSNLGSFIAQRLHLSEEHIRLLVSAGAASAISAAFNAPIAGVFFALEVVLRGELSTGSVSVVIIAAVMSAALTQGLGIGEAAMGPFNFSLSSPFEIPFFIPLGLLLAIPAAGFIRLFYWQSDLWQRLRLPGPWKTALAGALVGLVGIFLPEVLGGGREIMNEILNGELTFAFGLLLVLAVAKMLMTSISLAAGFVGGIFAPALFIGVMIGSAYGEVITQVFGGVVGDPRSYAIAGMAGMMAGVVRSPITAIMLVFELTNDYHFILPIMLVTVVCILISELFEKHGVYQLGLIRDGIVLHQGRDIDLMQSVTVGEAMYTPAPTIHEAATLTELRDSFRYHHRNALCVVNDVGRLTGIVSLSDLQRVYKGVESCAMHVGDMCTREVITAAPDDVLWTAIRKMGAYGVGRVPVVDPRTDRLVGMLNRHDIVDAYNTAIHRKMRDQQLVEQVRLNTLTGAHVYELYVNGRSPLVGMTIGEVKWPPETVVASILRKGKLVVPHGHTQLKAGDTLTIVADPHSEVELMNLFREEVPWG
ncbi:MAG: chloride channel protein [Chloroflexota bacterium]